MAIRDSYGYTTKTVNIGDWDMDADDASDVAHGLSATEWKTIKEINAIIRDDADSLYVPLDRFVNTTTLEIAGGVNKINSTLINLRRLTGSAFDTTSYDSTSYNRGWVTFEYIVD